uniref:Uncharacterized protein n=1 Tax=Glossina austeni TaxID=7395 RepID=A0A1A9VFP3_GLOAU
MTTLRSFKVFNNFHLLLLKLPLLDWSVHNSVFTLFLTGLISFMIAISPKSSHKLDDEQFDIVVYQSRLQHHLIRALTQDLGALYSVICSNLPSSSDDRDELEENG